MGRFGGVNRETWNFEWVVEVDSVMSARVCFSVRQCGTIWSNLDWLCSC